MPKNVMVTVLVLTKVVDVTVKILAELLAILQDEEALDEQLTFCPIVN